MIETSHGSRIVIADTSSLIVLAKIDSLEVLQKVYHDVRTTPEVVAEYRAVLPPWITIEQPRPDPSLVLDSELGPGERSAIELALQRSPCVIILDDLLARRAAIERGLDVIGTLGVLLEAKKVRIIPLIRPLLDRILQTDFRLSKDVVERVLRDAGEQFVA